jgi:hypothetical protein
LARSDTGPPAIAAFVDDLMDRSRLSAALPTVTYVRSPAGLEASVVIIDLAAHADAVPVVRAALPAARIVAFGSHVDGAVLDAARNAGADVVVPRSRFFRDPAAAVAADR